MTSDEAKMEALRVVAQWQVDREFVPNLEQDEDLAKSMRDSRKLALAIEKSLLKATRPDPAEFHGEGRGWDRDIA